MKMRPAREPITRMPWRCIHVLVETVPAMEDRSSTYSDERQIFHSRPHNSFERRRPHRVHDPPFSNVSMHNEIHPQPQYHHQPSIDFHGRQYSYFKHPHHTTDDHTTDDHTTDDHTTDDHTTDDHTTDDEIVSVEEFMSHTDHHDQVQLPPHIIEAEPRARIPPHPRQRSSARGRSHSQHSSKSNLRFSRSGSGDRPQSGHGRRVSAYSNNDIFQEVRRNRRVIVERSVPRREKRPSRRRTPFSTGTNIRTEVPKAPAPLSEDVRDMQDSKFENEEQSAGDPRSEGFSAEASQRVIDELLAKYTTILS